MARAHFDAKYALPAAASPTTILSTTGSGRGGGLPCPLIVNATLWMYSAIAFTSSSGICGNGGIGGMPGFCRPPERPAESARRADR